MPFQVLLAAASCYVHALPYEPELQVLALAGLIFLSGAALLALGWKYDQCAAGRASS